jgi:hypothetical protein
MSNQDKFQIVAELTAEERVTGATRAAERKLLAVEKMGQRVGGSLTNALGGLDRRLLSVERLSQRAGGTISNALGGSFALFGSGAFLGGSIKSFVGLNSQIEQAQVGLATLLSAQLKISGTDAMGLASSQLKDLRADAAAGIGELSDYMQGFQMILGPGLSHGGSLDQLRELNRLAISAGGALRGQEGMQLAAIDIVQALNGQVGERVTPFAMQALSAIGVTAEQFRKLKPEDRLGTLLRAFGAFSEGAKLMGETWDAQFSTLKDRVKSLIMDLSKPLFDRWKDQLKAVNSWLAKNEESLGLIVERWGTRMLSMWEQLVQHAATYAALVASAAVLPHAGAIGAAGQKAGAAGSAVMAGMRDPTGRARWLAQLRDQPTAGLTPGIFAMSRTGLATLGKALGRLALPVAIAVTAFQAIQGGISEYSSSLDFVKARVGELTFAFSRLGASFDIMTSKGSALNVVGAGLAYIFGAVVWIVTQAVNILATFVVGMGVYFRVLGSGYKGLWKLLTGQKNPFLELEHTLEDGLQSLKDIWFDPELSGMGTTEDPYGECETDDLTTATKPSLNVGKMEVTIKTETMEDEARVMRTMKTVIGGLMRNRTQPRRSIAAITG